ncbi:2OG-Fe(II) oxygenase [Nocardia alni]|uniref:2OG-Fe(II) oxygenase n=1 Tax=Nocardia alni TaxID=2815723 RepID=UPI001C218869|nr:2OG-Fe(II) oxygenase [Nocardia alni]
MIVERLWDDAVLRGVLSEFPEPDDDRWWRYNDNQREVKLEGGSDLWGQRTQEFVESIVARGPEFAAAFGLPELHLRTEGAGYHQIEPGGKLAVHADFNRSREGLYRRLNVIVYLNEDWTDADGGHLHLVAPAGHITRVLPQFNRTVIFETSSTSFHGHPVPLPGPRSRRSFASYFFTVEKPDNYVEEHGTRWHG